MAIPREQHRAFLLRLASEAMRERGFEPEFRAALGGGPCPYGPADLKSIGGHCTGKEDDAQRVGRRLVTSAASREWRSRAAMDAHGRGSGGTERVGAATRDGNRTAILLLSHVTDRHTRRHRARVFADCSPRYDVRFLCDNTSGAFDRHEGDPDHALFRAPQLIGLGYPGKSAAELLPNSPPALGRTSRPRRFRREEE